MSAPIFREQHTPSQGCFCLLVEGREVGTLTYLLQGGTMAIEHTVVPPEYGGHGYARLLVQRAAEYAREQGLLVLPHCSYAARVFWQEPSLIDLLQKESE